MDTPALPCPILAAWGPARPPWHQRLSSFLLHICCFWPKATPELPEQRMFLRKLKLQAQESESVSDYRSGWQFRVPFIKAAIRPIIYHHVFFTAVSQAAITKGNRFISWALKQDRDGW